MRSSFATAVVLLSSGFAGCGTPPAAETPRPSPPVATGKAAAPPAQVATTPDAPFRQSPPEGTAAIAFAAPQVVPFTLKNGVRVLLVERHDLPLVSIRVVFKAGAGDVRGLKPGVANFMGAMLEQGTEKRTAIQISDEFEGIGAEHSASVDWDSGETYVKVLVKELDKALELENEILRSPKFDPTEIDRLKKRRLAALKADEKDPASLRRNAFSPALYGRGHAYGHSLTGVTPDVEKISRDEIRDAYRKIFNPAYASIVVAGDVTVADLKPKLEASFGQWNAPRATAPVAAPIVEPKSGHLVVVDLPGAPQSQVFVGHPGVAMSTPDRDAIDVMNAILGGMFSSRINLNLREKHAYTYGARSWMTMRHSAGPFAAGGAMVANATAASIRELLAEIKKMREEPVSADELGDAKQSLKLQLPARFETVTQVTGALSEVAVYDFPLNEFATRPTRIDAVTAADVQRVAKKYLRPNDLKVIVVGDRAALEGSLKELGLGPIEERDASGDVKSAAPLK